MRTTPISFDRPLVDSFDAKILDHLQRDGRLTSVQLSTLIALSQSPTNRRMSQLRDDGVIRRTMAILDPKAVGWPVRVVVICSLDRTSPDAHDRFVVAASADPAVSDIDAVMGGADFVLGVRARSVDGYHAWLRRYHEQFPNLRDVKSFLVLDEVKRYAPIPVENTGSERD